MANLEEQLMWALKNKDLDKLKEINGTDKGIVTRRLKNGRHPMCIAADFGQVEVLQFLVQHGADVNVVDGLDMTPLLCAVYESHKDCITFLLSKGAKKVSPDGKPYADSAETKEIKDMLQ